MAVTMNLQRHSKSGVWRYRRRVPQECQSAIGKTWIIESLGTKDRGKAKLAVLAVHAYWEAQFADAKNGTYQTEGERRISGLLSEWQNELFMVGTNPDAKWTPPFHDVHEIEQSIDEWQHFELEQFGANDQLNEDTRRALILAAEKWYREQGQYENLTLPDVEAKPIARVIYAPTVSSMPSAEPVSFWAIYDDWAAESGAAPKTVYSWRAIMTKLTTHLGHEDAARITDSDIIRWKDALVKSELSPKTIGNHLTIAKTLFNWAAANKRILSSPAAAVRYKAKSDPSTKKLPFGDEDTKRILTAARGEKEAQKRWVPWLCAFSGARVDEICGAMVRDIDVIDGYHCFHIRLDHREKGGSLKNEGSERVVPLHPALIAEGFLKYVESLPKGGPLFPNVTPDRFGKRGGNGSKTIGRWIRKKVGITNPRLQPNHAWRHRFKSIAPEHGMRLDVENYLTGHAGEEGSAADYRHFGMKLLAKAIAKLPVP